MAREGGREGVGCLGGGKGGKAFPCGLARRKIDHQSSATNSSRCKHSQRPALGRSAITQDYDSGCVIVPYNVLLVPGRTGFAPRLPRVCPALGRVWAGLGRVGWGAGAAQALARGASRAFTAEGTSTACRPRGVTGSSRWASLDLPFLELTVLLEFPLALTFGLIFFPSHYNSGEVREPMSNHQQYARWD